MKEEESENFEQATHISDVLVIGSSKQDCSTQLLQLERTTANVIEAASDSGNEGQRVALVRG
jgi:hypothetical protein